MSIQAVIFDVGGVISRVEDQSKIRVWEERLGLAEKELPKIIFGAQAAARAMVGEISGAELWQYVGRTLALDAGRLAELERDFWAGWQLDAELIRFIRSLRPRYKTALLSNAFSDARQAFVHRFGLGDAVDAMIISAEEGLAKPDPRIYHLALNRLGVQPQAAIFVDDQPENVLAAQELGLHGIQFKNTFQTITDITRHLDEHLDN